MKIQCKKCYSYFENESDECPYCGARVIRQPDVNKHSVEAAFCQHCGEKLESGAQFCAKCGRKVGEETGNSIGYHVESGTTNFVMEYLRKFGYMNDAIRKIGVISAVLLAIIQIFGMKYTMYESLWGNKKEVFSGSVVKTAYMFLTETNSVLYSKIEDLIFLWWICFAAFIIGYITLFVMCVITVRMVVSNYHIDSVIDSVEAMSTCAIIIFGVVVLFGMFISSKLEAMAYVTLKVNVLSYIALAYAVILRFASGMIIRTQLEKE